MSRKGIKRARGLPAVNTKWQKKKHDGAAYVYVVRNVTPKRLHMGVVQWEVQFTYHTVLLPDFLENYTPATEEAYGLHRLSHLVPK